MLRITGRSSNRTLFLAHVDTALVLNQSSEAVVATSVRDYDGRRLAAGEWLISCDQKYTDRSGGGQSRPARRPSMLKSDDVFDGQAAAIQLHSLCGWPSVHSGGLYGPSTVWHTTRFPPVQRTSAIYRCRQSADSLSPLTSKQCSFPPKSIIESDRQCRHRQRCGWPSGSSGMRWAGRPPLPPGSSRHKRPHS